jgi:hypothetical protein
LDFAPIYVFINLKIKPTPFCGLFLKEKEETGPVTLICTVHRFNHQPNCFTPIIKKSVRQTDQPAYPDSFHTTGRSSFLNYG